MQYNKNTSIEKVLPAFEIKKFVSATTLHNASSSNFHTRTFCFTAEESGDSISTYYTNFCCDQNRQNDNDDVSICDVVNERKPENKLSSCSNEKMLNKAMKFAEIDDKESLKTLIERGISVNSSDMYGWSLLMVASFAGAENVVQFLLSKGARKGKRDRKGNTALYLASKKNHTNIVNLLIKGNKNFQAPEGSINEDVAKKETSANTSNFCKICNLRPSCCEKKHNASISHLFKLGKYYTKPTYCIPRNNIGFQMLLQQGWNDSQGLGPEGNGRKYPIKYKEKKDRYGVGHEVNITKNEDCQSFCRDMKKSLNKKTSKQLEKLNEKKLRQLLNEPDMNEYNFI